MNPPQQVQPNPPMPPGITPLPPGVMPPGMMPPGMPQEIPMQQPPQQPPQQSQPEGQQSQPETTIFDELRYAYDGLIACLNADDLVRATLFAGILIQVSSTVQVRACQHLVNKVSPAGTILPGLYEETIVCAGTEELTNE